jgi:hypothetical protein
MRSVVCNKQVNEFRRNEVKRRGQNFHLVHINLSAIWQHISRRARDVQDVGLTVRKKWAQFIHSSDANHWNRVLL